MSFTYTKRKDGRLMKKVTINGKPQYLYSDNPNDLEREYIKLKYSDFSGSSITTCKFKDYAEKWISLNSSGKALATIKEYKYIINKYLIPNLGYMELNKIKRIDIQKLQSKLLNEKHNELAHKCIRYLNAIFNDAIANDFLVKNPCLGIKQVKVIHDEKKVLTDEQDKLLLKSLHKYAPFFRILRYTGLRREEISALTISDIDLETKIISVNKAVSFASNQPVLKETKNKKIRKIPILDIIYPDILNRINYCKENNIKFLFTKQTDITSMLSQESIRCMTNSFCKNIGFTFTPHQLRHSYCTMLYYSGITIKETQKLMGHSSADMVYNIYAHLDEEKENTSHKINSYLNNI